VFTVDATSGVGSCAFSYVDPGGDAGFGQALATGDFDADGALDLLVGSPPSHAFWIRGPLSATSAVLPVTLSGSGDGALGAAVAAANVDGVAGDEALVGDPDATVGGNLLAGAVHVVGGAMLGTELALLQRHEPSANDAFGVEVHALPFCTSACGTSGASLQSLLLVGSTSHAFAFFQPVAGSVDPRTK
jgi:FG-GAP repeat protein